MTEHVDTAAGAKKQYTPSICMSNRCIKWFQSRERLACAQHWNSLKWRIKNQQSVHTMFTFQKLTDSTTWMCIVPMMVLWWYFSQCRRNLAMTSLWGSAQEFQRFPIPQRMPWGVSLRCGSCTLRHVGHIAPVAVCIYRTCRYLSKYVYIYMYYVFSNKKCMFLVMCTLHELLQLLYNYLNTHSLKKCIRPHVFLLCVWIWMQAVWSPNTVCCQVLTIRQVTKIKTCETNFTIPWCLMSHFKAASLPEEACLRPLFWLAVWNMQFVWAVPYTLGIISPNWLIFFRGDWNFTNHFCEVADVWRWSISSKTPLCSRHF